MFHDRDVFPPHGYVVLENFMGGDLAVVNAARVSFGKRSDEFGEAERGILRYLMREQHGTPFENGGVFQFRVRAPIFVFREWHRHRAGWSYNEESGRYSELRPDFYLPSQLHTQVGKPGRYVFEKFTDLNDFYRIMMQEHCERAFELYKTLLGAGVAKQEARMVLPVSTYSEMIATCNARSLMHFLSLRQAETAQYEIREYANALFWFFSTEMPETASSFIEYGRKAP